MEFEGLENSPFSTSLKVGESLNVLRLYNFLGINPETGFPEFEDLDGDGNISFTDDTDLIGEIRQEYFGGFQNTVQWGGLELDFLFQFVKQNGRSYQNNFGAPGAQPGFNQPIEVFNNRWRAPGDITNVQQASIAGAVPMTNFHNSNGAIVDASYIRLRNVAISYNFKKELLKGIPISNLRVFLQGQNLLTITNYLGLDPETQSSFRLPPLRTITTGLQLTF